MHRETGRPSDFWARHDEAKAAADLFEVPPADIVAVVGPLDIATPVVKRCLACHWDRRCRVLVSTERPSLVPNPAWAKVTALADLVDAMEDRSRGTPLLVIDVAFDLPPYLGPLVAELRDRGLDLVHYVLDGEPTDEDLASWHGLLGRPSVLDLAAPIEPGRIQELLDRGEPIASIAGRPVTAELLLALDLDLRR